MIQHSVGEETHTSRTYRLICFCSTLVTRVGCNLHHGLHFGGSCHDSLDAHQLPDGISFHFANSEMLGGIGRFEIYFTERNYVNMQRLAHVQPAGSSFFAAALQSSWKKESPPHVCGPGKISHNCNMRSEQSETHKESGVTRNRWSSFNSPVLTSSLDPDPRLTRKTEQTCT